MIEIGETKTKGKKGGNEMKESQTGDKTEKNKTRGEIVEIKENKRRRTKRMNKGRKRKLKKRKTKEDTP